MSVAQRTCAVSYARGECAPGESHRGYRCVERGCAHGVKCYVPGSAFNVEFAQHDTALPLATGVDGVPLVVPPAQPVVAAAVAIETADQQPIAERHHLGSLLFGQSTERVHDLNVTPICGRHKGLHDGRAVDVGEAVRRQLDYEGAGPQVIAPHIYNNAVVRGTRPRKGIPPDGHALMSQTTRR